MQATVVQWLVRESGTCDALQVLRNDLIDRAGVPRCTVFGWDSASVEIVSDALKANPRLTEPKYLSYRVLFGCVRRQETVNSIESVGRGAVDLSDLFFVS